MTFLTTNVPYFPKIWYVWNNVLDVHRDFDATGGRRVVGAFGETSSAGGVCRGREFDATGGTSVNTKNVPNYERSRLSENLAHPASLLELKRN